MTRSDRETVVCTSCGWRGRRIRSECWCDDSYGRSSCACRWGVCPKCSNRVSLLADIREAEKEYRRMKEWEARA